MLTICSDSSEAHAGGKATSLHGDGAWDMYRRTNVYPYVIQQFAMENGLLDQTGWV